MTDRGRRRWHCSGPLFECLEARELLAASVRDVHLFYNGSKFDNNGLLVTTDDFAAIAPDKHPLSFGGTGDFTNISGYSRGINGIFFDVADLQGDGASLVPADLLVTVGNTDVPDAWASGPAATEMGVFPNIDAAGTDRIFVTFADGAIADTWVRLTLRANVHTGLAADAEFFFGGVPGETGAAFAPGSVSVDAADLLSVAFDIWPIEDKPIDNENDLNRDRRVNATDLHVVARNIGVDLINLISPNRAPVVEDQVFAVLENSAAGTLVGTVAATDLDGDALSYAITAGNAGDVFSIDAGTGGITLARGDALDQDVTPSYALTVQVSDGELSDTATVTIKIDEAPLADGLLAHYTLDEGSGSTIGGEPAGILHGPTWVNGVSGTALEFDGVDDYVDLGALDVFPDGSGNAGLTISTWFKMDGATSTFADGRLVSKAIGTAESNHYWMLSTIDSGGQTRLRYRLKTDDGGTSTLIASSGTVQMGNWHHAVATYDGSRMRLYLDGQEVGSLAKTGVVATNNSVAAWIGGNPPDAGAKPWDGLIDDVRMYSRGMSAEEVQQLYTEHPLPNRAPVLEDQVFAALENSAAGALVGKVAAADVDGDAVSYAITAGNTGNVFSIDAGTGAITVASGNTLDHDVAPSYALTVQVSDGELSDTATVTINVIDRTVTEAFVLFDFEDSVLHDQTWLDAQAIGTVAAYVAPKSDSGSDLLSLAPGEGIDGGTALLVESSGPAEGLPGLWVLKAPSGGGHIVTDLGYLLPQGMRANRLEFSFRFEAGYRSNDAALPNVYPNLENVNVGTYHFDPALIGGGSSVIESNNWHFYHQLWVRHDTAGDGWIKVVLNTTPHHQRGLNASPPPNPTGSAGDYWELLTRFYIDPVPYFADPEIPYPVRMWVDDIKLTYAPEPTDVAVQIENYSNGDGVSVPEGTTRDFQVTLTNTTGAPITGLVSSTTPYWLRPSLLEAATGQSLLRTITLAAGQTRQVIMRLTPDVTGSPSTYNAGVVFVPSDQFTTKNAGLESPLVEQRVWADVGPADATTYGAFVQVATGPSILASADATGATATVAQPVGALARIFALGGDVLGSDQAYMGRQPSLDAMLGSKASAAPAKVDLLGVSRRHGRDGDADRTDDRLLELVRDLLSRGMRRGDHESAVDLLMAEI